MNGERSTSSPVSDGKPQAHLPQMQFDVVQAKLLQNCVKISCDAAFLVVTPHSSQKLTSTSESESWKSSKGGLASSILITGRTLSRTVGVWMKDICLSLCTRYAM